MEKIEFFQGEMVRFKFSPSSPPRVFEIEDVKTVGMEDGGHFHRYTLVTLHGWRGDMVEADHLTSACWFS